MPTQKWMLLTFAIICLPLISAAQPFVGKDGKYIRKGCRVVLGEPKRDTQMIVDPITGEEFMKERVTPGSPDSINGKRVYDLNSFTTEPQSYSGKPSLDKYLVTKLKKDIEALQLADGELEMNLYGIIIDEKGSVVYYEYRGMMYRGKNETVSAVNEKLAPKISKLMAAAPAMKPATLNGTNIMAYTNSIGFRDFKATIKNHVVTYKKD